MPSHTESDDDDVRAATPDAAATDDDDEQRLAAARPPAGAVPTNNHIHVPSPPAKRLAPPPPAEPEDPRPVAPSDSFASIEASDSPPQTEHLSGKVAALRKRKSKGRKSAEELAEERRRVDAAMDLLEDAKRKARAQRQDYGEYLAWKVTMQRQEHKQREIEEEKLRERVNQKLQQVLAEHKGLRRRELTAYRHLAEATPAMFRHSLGVTSFNQNGGNETIPLEEISASRIVADEDGPSRIRVPRRRLQIANSFAEEDAHFQSFMVEQERRREEWARTKQLLHANAMKAASAKKAEDRSQSPPSVQPSQQKKVNYAEVFAKESAQRRPDDGYVQIKDGSHARSAVSQAAANLQRLARSYDMQPAPPRAAIDKRRLQAQNNSDGSDDESAVVSQFRSLIDQTRGDDDIGVSRGPDGVTTLVDPSTGVTLEYVVEDSARSAPISDTMAIVRKSKLTQAEHELLVRTSRLRFNDGQRRVKLDEMMRKSRLRKEYASELLSLDPPADLIIANGLDRLLPADILQIAYTDQQVADGLSHGKLKKPTELCYLVDHEDNEANLASRSRLKGVLAQRRGNSDDSAFFMTEVTGDDAPAERQTQSAPTTTASPHRRSLISKEHHIPRTTKSSWYPKYSANPHLVTPIATKRELDALLVRQAKPATQDTLSATNDGPLSFSALSSTNASMQDRSQRNKVVSDTLVALQGDDYVPYDTTVKSDTHLQPLLATSASGGPAPKVVAVRFPPRRHDEEKAIYDWHTKQESVTVRSSVRPKQPSGVAATTTSDASLSWKHKPKPFLPPLKSIFVDPDLDTAKKFLRAKRSS